MENIKNEKGILEISHIEKMNAAVYRAQYPGCSKENTFYKEGMMVRNDQVYHLFGYFEIAAWVECGEGNAYTMELDMVKDRSPKAEYHIFAKKDISTLQTGSYILHFPLDQFNLEQGLHSNLQFVRGMKLLGEKPFTLTKLLCRKGKRIAVECPVSSKAAEAGEYAVYEGRVFNCTEEPLLTTWAVKPEGWEALHQIELPEALLLLPQEKSSFTIRVKMTAAVVPGGFETQRIIVTPDIYGDDFVEIKLKTLRRMKHPFVIMTETELDEVRQKIKKYTWAEEVYQDWMKISGRWQVPAIDIHKSYCFVTRNAHEARGAATMYRLSGDYEMALRVITFLKEISDPLTGYCKTLCACNQELVHEGEFFKSTAIAYDLVYDCPELTAADHMNIEAAMRCFMDYIDLELQKGGISNWTLAETAGALYCACVLQDRERIERFLYGVGGAAQHLRIGVMSDGWWYEASIGYNLLCVGLFSEISQVVSHYGIDFKHIQTPACYAKSVQAGEIRKDGLVVDNWGKNDKNYRNIPMLWDSLLPFYDYRGVIMGVNDSAEMKAEGISHVLYDSRFDIAYYLYRKPEYAYLMRNVGNQSRDLLFGAGEFPLPDREEKGCQKSWFADNGGAVVLRSRKKGAADRQQLQVGLKYGSHGGAHGHYDRASMSGLMRYGRSLINPENIWYSYHTMMYKFYVQNSISHNMVTVDLKQQDPEEPRRLLFYTSERMQACALENYSRWCNPPYGGWPVGDDKDFALRCFHEGRYVPIPENPPEYGTRTDFTEKILTRRLCVVTDDYLVNFDYAAGAKEHDYDCLYHLQGLQSIQGLEPASWSEKLEDNPLSSAQFITDCHHYNMKDGARLSFAAEFSEDYNNGNHWLSNNRTAYNETGITKTDLYLAWPKTSQVLIACDPEYQSVNKDLYYQVNADGAEKAKGAFGAWILGRDEIDVDIAGCRNLELKVKVEDVEFESVISPSDKTVFWGNPCLVLADGSELPLSGLPLEYENTDTGNGIGVDYQGGPVKLQAVTYDRAVPAEPLDKSLEGVIRLSLKGLGAVRFTAAIGGDYPVGEESGRRRTVCLRQRGKEAFFVTVLEPYEEEPQIVSVEQHPVGASGEYHLRVLLRNGLEQHLLVTGMREGIPEVQLKESNPI